MNPLAWVGVGFGVVCLLCALVLVVIHYGSEIR
jgi:hypothetical protein